MIDTIEQTGSNLQDAFVWQREHNETKWFEEFLFDSTSQQFFKSEFLTLTLRQNDLHTRIDSIIERTSFYQVGNSFVAVVFTTHKNRQLLDSLIIFLDCQKGELNSIYPNVFKVEEFRGLAKDAWLEEIRFKNGLAMKNGG